ncbi:hypothetical protein J4475_00300 [Candidatus Woesearchaeota archaeon]|nr:hypothetical protein [Candidatus Woesearchaeota archaeon]
MGTILSTKFQSNNKVHVTLSVDYEDIQQLQGRMDNIHMFCAEQYGNIFNISSRGKNERTKYLLIPRDVRRNINFDSEAACQVIETANNYFFIYKVDKTTKKVKRVGKD